MIIAGIADTHTIIWYLNRDKRLAPRAKAFIDDAAAAGDAIGVSPITFVETIYLIEKSRVTKTLLTRMIACLQVPDGVFVEVPFDLDIAQTLQRVPWADVPEMPDRIIAATALHLGVPVISRDSEIQSSDLETVW